MSYVVGGGINSMRSEKNSTRVNIGGISKLIGNISAEDTTVVMADGTKFPNSGTFKIGQEYMAYTEKDGDNKFVHCLRGAYGSPITSHSGGDEICGVFVGQSELNSQTDVMVSTKTDINATEFFDFSNDNINWDSLPLLGFHIRPNTHEFHVAIKSRRHFRIRLETLSPEMSTYLDISTYYGIYRQVNLPLHQELSDDADSIVTRSVGIGKQPDGDYVNAKSTGNAFATDILLKKNETFISDWHDTDGWDTIEIFVSSDVPSQEKGIQIEFTNNVQRTPTITRGIRFFEFNPARVSRGYHVYNIGTTLDGFRLIYKNGNIDQSDFYLSVTLKVNPMNFLYNKSQALLTADFISEVAFGHTSNYSTGVITGRNTDIDTGPEDVWEHGDIYTGQPVSFTPEKVCVLSTSTNDTIGGTAAQQIEIHGLLSPTSTDYKSEIIELNGTLPAISTKKWWRIIRANTIQSGNNNSNEGIITIHSEKSTTNVFATINDSFNNSNVGVFTVPYGKKIIIKMTSINIIRKSGASGSATVTLRARLPNCVYRAIQTYDIHTGANIRDTKLGGNALTSGTDIKFTVESVSDINTIVNVTMEYLMTEI